MKRDRNKAPGEYTVGYGRPPLHSRWKPGFCPNPKGRGKGNRNFETEVNEELKAKITIQENGKRKRITKRQAVAKQLVNKAASGDLKAMPVLFNQSSQLGNKSDQLEAIFDTPDDKALLNSLLERFRGALPSHTGGTEGEDA